VEGLGKSFETRFSRYGNEWTKKLVLSNYGKPLRQLWYDIKSGLPGEVLPANKKLNFLYGDVLEDLLVLLAIEAGHTVSDLQRKVEVDGVSGRIDGIIDGVLVDIKSTSSRSFEKFKDGSLRFNDPFGYIGQLAGYSAGLGGIDGAFWAIDKQLGHQTVLRISGEDLAKYRVSERIEQAKRVLDRDTPPEEKCYPAEPEGKSGNEVLAVGCSYCAYKHPCWSDANGGTGLRTFLYSNGPKFLTHVEREPKVFEVK